MPLAEIADGISVSSALGHSMPNVYFFKSTFYFNMAAVITTEQPQLAKDLEYITEFDVTFSLSY